jgi:hypothetical protein
MLNVGALNHPYHPHGNHLRQIAQDGRPFAPGASSEHFGETIGSGQTEDYLLTWADQDFWDPVTNKFPNGSANIDYRNLTFKDGNTYFSGSAYLGLKGTLPTGTVQQNVCGEWYFPWHSHALNEFANFDEGFGGMATLMRVDPRGGCFAYPTSTATPGGVVKSGTYAGLGVDDANYYQVNPKTTTRPTATNTTQTSITVASASGFPGAGSYYVRIDNEVMQVTGGQGTTTWTVSRGQLGTTAATHAANAVVTALADDWLAEPQAHLQGQKLRRHDGHDVRRADREPAAADGQDLRLDGRRRGRLLDPDLGRLGDAAAAAGPARRVHGREHHVDAVGPGGPLHRHRRQQGAGARAGPHPALDGDEPDAVLDLGQPDEARLRRAVGGEARDAQRPPNPRGPDGGVTVRGRSGDGHAALGRLGRRPAAVRRGGGGG